MKADYPQTSNQVDPSDRSDLVNRIEKKIQESISSTTEWVNKQDTFYKMRMRVKKDKTFPFKNASNLRMPTAESYIRKAKAGIMNVVFGLRPIVQAIPSPGGNVQVANKIEKFYDHLIMDVMGFRPKATMIVDQTLEKGLELTKPFWRLDICDRVQTIETKDLEPQELQMLMTLPIEQIVPVAVKRFEVDMAKPVRDENTDALIEAITKLKAGEQKVKLNVRDVLYNAPDVSLIAPDRCYVPTYSGVDVQGSEFVVHEYILPIDAVERKAEERGWSKEAVDEIKEYTGRDNSETTLDMTKDLREGITLLSKSGLVKIREFYGYEDIGNGKKEKVIVAYSPSFSKELKKAKWQSYSGDYPFVKFFYELTDDRWFSHRGIPELLEDIIKEIDTQHNIKIDQQTIRNAPMFVYRSGMVNPNMVQMKPNQAIPVKGTMALGDVVQALNFNNPNVEYSYEREQQLLESKAQELLGQPDYSLQSMINRRQPRTLGEVQMQASSYQNIFGLDASMFVDSFSKLFNMIMELWCEFGEEEYEFNYFGADGRGETVKLSREEIQNKYTVVVRGNDSNTNPNTKLQKAQQIIMAVTNPVLLQSGVMTPMQQIEGVKRFYEALDVEGYESLVNSNPPPPPQPPPPDPAQRFKVKFSDLDEEEKAQVLAQSGLEPNIEGRKLDKDRNVATEEMQMAKMMLEEMGDGQAPRNPNDRS